MKEGIKCVHASLYRTEKALSSLVKNQFLPTCIQIINTHGDAIYVFLWMEED